MGHVEQPHHTICPDEEAASQEHSTLRAANATLRKQVAGLQHERALQAEEIATQRTQQGNEVRRLREEHAQASQELLTQIEAKDAQIWALQAEVQSHRAARALLQKTLDEERALHLLQWSQLRPTHPAIERAGMLDPQQEAEPAAGSQAAPVLPTSHASPMHGGSVGGSAGHTAAADSTASMVGIALREVIEDEQPGVRREQHRHSKAAARSRPLALASSRHADAALDRTVALRLAFDEVAPPALCPPCSGKPLPLRGGSGQLGYCELAGVCSDGNGAAW